MYFNLISWHDNIIQIEGRNDVHFQRDLKQVELHESF
jgi:hypothetical protein